jgi:hypothetical protein
VKNVLEQIVEKVFRPKREGEEVTEVGENYTIKSFIICSLPTTARRY